MRLGWVFACVLLASCAGLDKPAIEGFDQIRAAIVVSTDTATGATVASSAPAAKEEIERPTFIDGMDLSGTFSGVVPSGRAKSKFYVVGEKAVDGVLQVYLVNTAEFPVAEGDAQQKPWTQTNPDFHGYVGDPWREVRWELVEYRHECAARLCTRFSTDRMKLTDADIRAILAEGRDEIRVSFGERKIVSTRLDRNQLLAVLDALGVRDLFL